MLFIYFFLYILFCTCVIRTSNSVKMCSMCVICTRAYLRFTWISTADCTYTKCEKYKNKRKETKIEEEIDRKGEKKNTKIVAFQQKAQVKIIATIFTIFLSLSVYIGPPEQKKSNKNTKAKNIFNIQFI